MKAVEISKLSRIIILGEGAILNLVENHEIIKGLTIRYGVDIYKSTVSWENGDIYNGVVD